MCACASKCTFDLQYIPHIPHLCDLYYIPYITSSTHVCAYLTTIHKSHKSVSVSTYLATDGRHKPLRNGHFSESIGFGLGLLLRFSQQLALLLQLLELLCLLCARNLPSLSVQLLLLLKLASKRKHVDTRHSLFNNSGRAARGNETTSSHA